MSDQSSTSGSGRRPETDNSSGAYVLNALNEEERNEFEARMSESDEIRTEVAELNDTALLLGHAVEPVTPSDGLRASILDLIESTPQLPRLEAQEPRVSTHEDVPFRDASATSAAQVSHDAEILDPTPLARQRWFLRPAVLLVGAAAAVGLLFGGVAIGGNIANPQQSSVQPSAMSEILSAPDVQHTVADVTTGGKATLYWSDSLQRSAVILDGVTALPSNKTYQLWYINGKHIASAGTVSVTSNNVSQVLQGDLQKGDTIGITVEPAGGSKQPTSKPIVAIDA